MFTFIFEFDELAYLDALITDDCWYKWYFNITLVLIFRFYMVLKILHCLT